MGGETEAQVSGWTVDTLRVHLDTLLDERDRRYEERFTAAEDQTRLALTSSKEAVTKAEAATEKRFDAVNEFRATLSDQATNLLPRAEAAARFTAYDEKIDDIKRDVQALREARSEGVGGKVQAREFREQANWTIGQVTAISLSIGAAAVSIVIVLVSSGR